MTTTTLGSVIAVFSVVALLNHHETFLTPFLLFQLLLLLLFPLIVICVFSFLNLFLYSYSYSYIVIRFADRTSRVRSAVRFATSTFEPLSMK